MAKLWAWLFGRGKAASGPREPRSERVEGLLEALHAMARPCLRLVPGKGGRSRLGGRPETAGPWPRFQGRPMSLVAQLDLSEMRAAGGPDWLPDEGRLLFFYDLEYSGWGFDPADAGCALVRFETDAAAPARAPKDLSEDLRIAAYPVRFEADRSTPSEERLNFDWHALSRREQGDLEEAVEALTPAEPAHQVGGYAAPIQTDEMELQCQLVSNGVYMGKAVTRDPRAPALEPGAADWRLLLQIDSDEDAEVSWGDGGRLYFWIREQDARAGDFSKTWTILQCY